MRVLITGGAGLIGARLADRLLGFGDEVVLVDVVPDDVVQEELSAKYGGAVYAAQADVRDQSRLREVLSHHRPNMVVHLASLLGSACTRNPRLASEVNVLGSVNIFELARELGVRRVVCGSSISVYGDDGRYREDELPLEESADLKVASGVRVYGASKVLIEALAEAYQKDGDPLIVGLRASIVYGAVARGNSVSWIHNAVVSASRGQETKIANGDAVQSLVHVDDVADQFVALVKADDDAFGQTRFFNSGGDQCSARDFGESLALVCPAAHVTVEPGAPGAVMGLASQVSGARIDALMGYPRRYSPPRAGIEKYVADLRGASES